MTDIRHDNYKLLLRWSGWFFFANAILYLLISSRYLMAVLPFNPPLLTVQAKVIVWVFTVMAYIGHFSLLALIPCVVTLLIAYLSRRAWLVTPIAVLLASFILTFLIVDTFIFIQYRFHFNGVIFHMIFGGESREIFDFSWLEYLLCVALVLGVVIIETIVAYLVWLLLKTKDLPRGGLWVCVVLTVIYFAALGMYLGYLRLPMSRLLTYVTRTIPFYDTTINAILPGNIYTDMQRSGEQYLVQPDQAYQPLAYPLTPLVCKPNKKPLNIVMIVVDTWRYDMLNKAIMPNTYNLSQKSLIFSQHFSGGNCTRSGIFTLFYGIPATYWTAMEKFQQSPVLMDELIKQHYNMAVYASAELREPAFNKTAFVNVKGLRTDSPGKTPSDRDRYITAQFQQFITEAVKQKQPFFSFLFYDSAHTFCSVPDILGPLRPVANPCNRLELSKDADPTPYFNRYKNALILIDAEIKQDIEVLERNHLLDNTVIIVTGDHGQEFNDNGLGYWGHASNFTRYQVQTPLMIYWPGKKHTVYNYQTTHYDIAPTILTTLLNCQTNPNQYSVGSSLFNTAPRSYNIVGSYINFGIVKPGYIINVFPTGNFEIEDPTGRPISGAKLDLDVVKQAFQDMKKFYKQ